MKLFFLIWMLSISYDKQTTFFNKEGELEKIKDETIYRLYRKKVFMLMEEEKIYTKKTYRTRN